MLQHQQRRLGQVRCAGGEQTAGDRVTFTHLTSSQMFTRLCVAGRNLPFKKNPEETVSCKIFSSAVTCDGGDDVLGCLTCAVLGRSRPRLDSATLA